MEIWNYAAITRNTLNWVWHLLSDIGNGFVRNQTAYALGDCGTQNHTSHTDRYHLHTPLITGSAQNYVLELFNCGRQQLNGSVVISHICFWLSGQLRDT